MKKVYSCSICENIFKKGKNKKLHYIAVWSLDSLIKKNHIAAYFNVYQNCNGTNAILCNGIFQN
jgi:hypothetical protein